MDRMQAERVKVLEIRRNRKTFERKGIGIRRSLVGVKLIKVKGKQSNY